MTAFETLIHLMDRSDLETLAKLKLAEVESSRDLHEWYFNEAEDYGRDEDMALSNKYLQAALDASREYAMICERLDEIRNENRFWRTV